MDAAELRARFQQKLRQRADARRLPDFDSVPPGPPRGDAWPNLPSRESAPEVVLEALRTARDELQSGRWRAFGHLLLQIDDPPHWFTDYAARRALPTARPGFHLNHRELPTGADIKLIWELSRWHPIVRLAQAGWLLSDASATKRAIAWLEDWARRNPPYLGWNWTSALEAGIRL